MIYPFEGFVAHCSKLNLRISPSKNADIVDVLTEGTRLDVERFLEEPNTDQGDWYEVDYPIPGTTKIKHGFVMAEYVEPVEE